MAFTDSISRMNDAALRVFGRNVTFTPQVGSPSTVRAIVVTGVEAEETDRGVYAGLFAKAAAFSPAAQKGDQITVEGTVYKIVDLNSDGEGGLRMVLRKVA